MNFISHIHIAEQALAPAHEMQARSNEASSPPPERSMTCHVLFGAALPDFAAIGRFRLAQRPVDRWLALGVEAHHRTDDAFHHHPWFTDHSSRLRAGVERLGIGRGPARAIGHVGIELLLDGELIERRPTLQRTTDSVLSLADNRNLGIHEIVPSDQQAGWREHLARIADWRVAHDHHHPAVVAERLHRILRRRPRLSFERGQVPAVAGALTGQLDAMGTGINQMVADVVSRVSADLNNATSGNRT
jgi:hypothetical protein